MKKLITLISTEEKTKEQIVKETWKAYSEYLASRKPFSPAVAKVIMTLSRTGVLEKIGKAPPEKQAELLESCIASMLKQI